MSDRGFGDQASRNVVKNPLLSTAVIGVSLEDLTHNAVLLPAVPSQELITRQDVQSGSQAHSLVHSDQNATDLSSGDGKSNFTHTQQPVNLNPPVKSFGDNNSINDSRNATSKAPVSAEDDFDVNEYFARLHGTRYVSAPLNSAVKEERDNLNTEEENLEEINLNEPDKSATDEFQHSLTSDIAQNFSQLPTVLPQVASAVFSSFSNMLSMKSREQTPDAVKQPEYYEPQIQRPEDASVPLMSAPEMVKDLAPPPKEPPIIGAASNYRITTRKKMYAQIPGLRSGHISQNTSTYSPLCPANTPSYFIPEATNVPEMCKTETNLEGGLYVQVLKSPFLDNIVDRTTQYQITHTDPNSSSQSYQKPDNHPFPPLEGAVPINKDIEIKTHTQKSQSVDTVQPNVMITSQSQFITTVTSANMSVIPPPPMFSNISKPEGQIDRTILPPSVARRISANHPVKQQAPPLANPIHNIFVPTFDTPVETEHNQNVSQAAKCFVPVFDSQSTKDKTPINDPHTNMAKEITSSIVIEPPSSKATGLSKTITKDIPSATLAKDNKKPHVELPHVISQPSDLSVKQLSQMNLDPPISKLTEELLEVVPSEKSLCSLSLSKPTILVPVPPPSRVSRIDSSATSNMRSKDIEIEENKNTVIRTYEFDPTLSGPIKNLPEPPKVSNNHNFRMIKKKPQYYSGPIEGVGSISNNIKPTINPVQTNTFQGVMYTPQMPLMPAHSTLEDSGISLSGIGQSVPPFDITQSMEDNTSFPRYEINQPQTQPDYNTVFDLSRQTTESFDRPQLESKGYGIIGSLKSKLSSIDINKIQNSVTTFFDPAYNYTKVDPIREQENKPYESMPSYKFPETQDNNLEIFVPKAEPALQSISDYNYQIIDGTNTTAPKSGSDVSGHSYFDFFANPSGNTYSTGYSNETLNYTHFGQTINATPWSATFPPSASKAEDVKKEIDSTFTCVSKNQLKSDDLTLSSTENVKDFNTSTDNTVDFKPFENQTQGTNLIDNSYFSDSHVYCDTSLKQDLLCKPSSSKMEEEMSSKDSSQAVHEITENNKLFGATDLMSAKASWQLSNVEMKENVAIESDIKQEVDSNSSSHITGQEHFNNLDNSTLKYFETPATAFQGISLFSQPLSNEYKNIAENPDKSNIILFADSVKQENNIRFDESAAAFFDKPKLSENKLIQNILLDEPENDNDLNICETCREVNKPEEKEVENLTDQLIENITAPIQLSNPVEVPLADNGVPGVSNSDFEPDQCAEISHVTEETIEAIHVQAATELLDVNDNNTTIVKNYAWIAGDSPLPTSNVLVEHDYTLQLVGNSAGFFQNKSLFFDNIPTNASDEIKAEYKNSFDDTTTVLPRQMSIPTAPPAEEDSKSDESGLDVQSIEQDAKKDFPIFEEYVIEPSETDDDKIEFKERERSSEDPVQEGDTFTSRVERYKKMEETQIDHSEEVFGMQKSSMTFELPTSTSPSITIASYFDTGNYAVENHYRNSLTSPSSLYAFHSMHQIPIMRIPPGFENEFKRKLSLLSNEGFLEKNKADLAQFIPDTLSENDLALNLMMSQNSSSTSFPNSLALESTNTGSTSISTEQLNKEATDVSIENVPTNISQSEMKLPDFASAFGVKSKEYYEDNKNESVSLFSNTKTQSETIHEPITNIPASLPESTDLFSSDPTPTTSENSDVYDFSRLSSYFSAPTQSDPSKSFFELSQSENHYRQEKTNPQNMTANTCDESTTENSSSLQQNICDKLNIPHEKYIANMNLMKDLTSTANIDFIPKEQIVRSVNYFTVVYDNDSLNNKSNKREHKTVETNPSDSVTGSVKLLDRESKHSCNIGSGLVRDSTAENLNSLDSKNVKDRRHMSKNSSEARKEIKEMETKKDDTGRSFTVSFEDFSIDEDKEENVAMVAENRSAGEYSPVKYHWFYQAQAEEKVWKGFSVVDSNALENAFSSPELDETTLVATDGGRYDVNVVGRLRVPVYWSDKPTNVLRCSWFYKGNTDARYVPYAESIAEMLEEEYKHGVMTGEWHRRLILPNDELVVMHGPSVMEHHRQSSVPDAFSSSPQSVLRPWVVRRGCADIEIEDTEPSQVDHLLLLCHGVGSACDMRFRPVEDVVDDFRATSLQLIQSHYKNSYESGIVGRIEVLPISWHSTLHSGEGGVDKRLAQVTLDSIPRLRNFTNDTVLDVLFYTSPVYCQTIIDTVCKELNRIYSLFRSRNPSFNGGVSLGGHSLGSVIMYDLLCHQTPAENTCPDKRYVNGTAGTGQPTVKYPHLEFRPDALYALGSPIAIFECIRGVELLGPGFCLPTCSKFFNIFHPYDPIAYRIEPLINPQLRNVKPFQIPHHKGRKRMHLELKDTMARFGTDIKQKLMELFKNTWSSMWKAQPPAIDRQLEKVVEEEIEKEQLQEENDDVAEENEVSVEMLGKLNGGRRVDYVLQEAPFEMINEYLFAMSSHVGYWESEDTMLLMLREVYDTCGVRPDGCLPQQTLTVQRTRLADADIYSVDHPSTSRGGI
ncbi:serine-rich adhesin for platelets [Battus philenor]|uniref:serine-rich adhesin for platelets n=1 Tax=Battus philenor TaxID=42288 RepID=UPI0035D057D5